MPDPTVASGFARSSVDGRFAIRITPPALAAMLSACREAPENETGGVLIGEYTPDLRVAIVAIASSRPYQSRSGRSWFVRGIAGLARWLDELWQARSGYYLGEWHYHPFASPVPSQQDVEQMCEVAQSKEYQCATPLLVIVGGDPAGEYLLHAEVFTDDGTQHPLVTSESCT